MTKTMKIGSATVTVDRPELTEEIRERRNELAEAGLARFGRAMEEARKAREEKNEPAAAVGD